MTLGGRQFSQTFPISALFDPRVFARAVSARGMNPPILYHYTDETALRGIVSPPSWDFDHPALDRAAQLWASDVRYMNDAQELLFGAAPLVERLRAAAAAADSSLPANLAAKLARLAEIFSDTDVLRWDLKCFAACLCDSPEVVSQWQVYARTGGYAIGFSWDALAEHSFALHPESTAVGNSPFPAGLRWMTYGKPAAEAMAEDVVRWVRSAYEGPQGGGMVRTMIQGGESGLRFLASVILARLASVKHGDFQHEREWRLVAVSEPGYPAKVRQSGGGDLPYLQTAVNMNDTNVPVTIAKLVVGPGPDQPGRIALARQLLEGRGHDPDVVVGHKGPLRW